ncbi:hypothetical protein D3C85_1878660 [compost metagenome]
MQVLRQQHPGVDAEGVALAHLLDRRTQGSAQLGLGEQWAALLGAQGEEVQAAIPGAAVVGHSMSLVVVDFV